MENDIYKALQTRVFDELKRRVDASVYVKIADDILQVKIKKLGFQFGTTFDDIIRRASEESDLARTIVADSVKQYKSFIFATFFKSL